MQQCNNGACLQLVRSGTAVNKDQLLEYSADPIKHDRQLSLVLQGYYNNTLIHYSLHSTFCVNRNLIIHQELNRLLLLFSCFILLLFDLLAYYETLLQYFRCLIFVNHWRKNGYSLFNFELTVFLSTSTDTKRGVCLKCSLVYQYSNTIKSYKRIKCTLCFY